MAKKHVFTADGSSPIIYGRGGVRAAVASGDFGGGSLGLEVSHDDGANWISDSGVIFTSDGVLSFYAPKELPFRLTLTGSTNPDLNLAVY